MLISFFRQLLTDEYAPSVISRTRRVSSFLFLMIAFLAITWSASAQTAYDYSRLRGERLNRGTVTFRTSPDSVCVQWRYLPSDPQDLSFEVLRDGNVIGRTSATAPTFLMDYNPVSEEAVYQVRPVYRNGLVPKGLKTSDSAYIPFEQELDEE